MPEDGDHDDPEKQEGGEFVCVATFLPLKCWKYMLLFQLMTSKVLKQAKKSEGAVNYAVKANFPNKHFWTLSAWKDRDSLMRFVMAEPHATAIAKFGKCAGGGAAFVEWASSNGSIDWPEALNRLSSPTFYYGNKK